MENEWTWMREIDLNASENSNSRQMNARWWWRSDWLDSQFEVCFLFLFIVFAHDLVRRIPVNIWKGLLALWQIKYVRHHTKTKTFTHNKNLTENGRAQRNVETKHRNYKLQNAWTFQSLPLCACRFVFIFHSVLAAVLRLFLCSFCREPIQLSTTSTQSVIHTHTWRTVAYTRITWQQ